MKINLGGTCGESNWRDVLIAMLSNNIEYRNPIVPIGTWKYNIQTKKSKKKKMEGCDYLIYVITPEQKGFSSIASAVDYSNKVPKKVLFCILYEWNNQRFEGHQLESINSVKDIIENNGGRVFENLESIATFLNNKV